MNTETITDRTGRTISQDLIDKAERLTVTTEAPGHLYRVEGDTGTYLVAIDSSGHADCRCRWNTETGTLCSHIMAVKLHAMRGGVPVHINMIDGYRPRVVDESADPFEGL